MRQEIADALRTAQDTALRLVSYARRLGRLEQQLDEMHSAEAPDPEPFRDRHEGDTHAAADNRPITRRDEI